MEFFAYFNGYQPLRQAAERALINPVADVGGSTFVWMDAPVLIYDGARLLLFFEGSVGEIYEVMGLVYSDDDGVSWQWHPNGDPLVRPAMVGWNDDGDFACPCPIIVNGQRYMIYAGKTVIGEWNIGAATTDDWVTSYTNDPGNPVLSRGAGGEWDDETVYHPCIIREGDTFYLFYTGHAEPPPFGAGHPGIGLATTSIGNFPTGWVKHGNNPLIDMASRPKVKKIGSIYYMLYTKIASLWLAYSDDLVSWIEVGPVSADVSLVESDFIAVNGSYILAGMSSDWNAVFEIGILDPSVKSDEVDLGGRCRSDFGDVRFAASDLSNLYYYMEREKINGFFQKFTAKIGSIPIDPNEATMYVYYGKADATEESDPDNVFDFFDHHETDLSKWAVDTTGGTAALVAVPTPPEGSKSVELDDTDGVEVVKIEKFGLASRDYRVSYYIRSDKSEAAQNIYPAWKDAPNDLQVALALRNAEIQYYDTDWRTLRNYWPDVWYLIEYVFRLGAETFDIWIFSEPEGTNLDMRSIVEAQTGLSRGTAGASIIKGYFDLHKVRKYIDPEPTHESWGSEESTSWVF